MENLGKFANRAYKRNGSPTEVSLKLLI